MIATGVTIKLILTKLEDGKYTLALFGQGQSGEDVIMGNVSFKEDENGNMTIEICTREQ